VLVDRLDDPVDAGITTDGLVLRVDEDDFEILVGAVLVDPVRVLAFVSFDDFSILDKWGNTYEDSEIGATATNALFCCRPKRALVLELVHTLVRGLAVGCALWHWSLPATTAEESAYIASLFEELGHTVEPGCGRSHSWRMSARFLSPEVVLFLTLASLCIQVAWPCRDEKDARHDG
jgi:hypothetical protein